MKKRVAIVHAQLGGGNGGSEARAMWAAEALKRDFAVTLVTAGPIDLAGLNLFYGTEIDPQEISLYSLPMPRLLARERAPAALRGAFGGRSLKFLHHDHEILISTYNPCDFGTPGIQCVADFSWDEGLRRRFDPAPGGVHNLFHRYDFLRRCYLRLCKTIAPPSGRDVFAGEDVILANSRWTAAMLRERYGAIAPVVYPPVAGNFPDVSHEHRYDDFVCIGRISAEKRIERMIRIIGAVRRIGHNARIRVIGPIDASPYAKSIVDLASHHRDWVLLEGRKVGVEKARVLSACRYGIHGRNGEAFGIGVAEMVKAGCITFAPSEGGPAEIVDHEALVYRSDEDAVEKIAAVLDSEALRLELIHHLRDRTDQFSPEAFMVNFRKAIDWFIRKAAGPTKSLPQSAFNAC
jgi:glycosyltransferase involved in cell wall biosynthesis